VQAKHISRLTLISAGIALLLAALFFDMGTAASRAQESATPTPDRLAEPTLPASPSQSDHGAQVYWLSCLPCHGDRGQGLTDEFRAIYPPEEQYCWESGCHGKRPYENGFTLPMQIPALVGPGTLQKFPTAANLRGFIFAAMPSWKPGSLTEEQSWQVTAFLLRQNGLWAARDELNASNADQVRVGVQPTATPEEAGPGSAIPPDDASTTWLAGGLLLFTLLLLTLFLRRRAGH
jgi:mono/diheme cytochrome c family protein